MITETLAPPWETAESTDPLFRWLEHWKERALPDVRRRAHFRTPFVTTHQARVFTVATNGFVALVVHGESDWPASRLAPQETEALRGLLTVPRTLELREVELGVLRTWAGAAAWGL